MQRHYWDEPNEVKKVKRIFSGMKSEKGKEDIFRDEFREASRNKRKPASVKDHNNNKENQNGLKTNEVCASQKKLTL